MNVTAERKSTLRGGSIGLSGAVVQSAALIAPAVGATAGMVFIASESGFASAFAMLVGMLISLCLAVVIGEFARKLPAAGSFYTYLTHAFGPKVGFVTGVMLFGAYILLLPFQLAFIGGFIHDYLVGQGVDITWQVFALALISITTVLSVAGLSPSLKVGLFGLAFETIIFSIVAVAVLVKGGAHGLSLEPFNPGQSAKGFSGVIYGLVFAIFAFVGFESATTLGEEVEEPRRNIPRAVLVTTIGIGLFYTLLMYIGVVGFGLTPNGLKALQSDGTPFTTLARTFVGPGLGTLVTIAVITSMLALNVVTVTAASRMIYAMGRDRMVPKWLGHVSHRGTPANAALAVGAFGAIVTVVLGTIFTPANVASWGAYISTLFFIAAYALLIIGVVKFYLQRHRAEFSPVRHAAVPLAGLIGVAIVTYGNVHPLPPSPLRYFIWATLAIIVTASIVARYLEHRDPKALLEAGQLFAAAEPGIELPVPSAAPHKAGR